VGGARFFLGANVIKIDNPRRNYMPFNITVYQYCTVLLGTKNGKFKLQNIKFEQDNFKWLISIFKFENCSKRGPSILKFVCRIYRFQLLFKYIQKGTLR